MCTTKLLYITCVYVYIYIYYIYIYIHMYTYIERDAYTHIYI